MSAIELDGSRGEGGGQVLRTAVAAAAILGRKLTIRRIRAGRRPPGLKAQHRAAVKAVAKVCRARVKGDQVGDTSLRFEPGPIAGGEYEFDIGTAGSTTLVLQTVLPVLLHADEPSTVTIHGGTENTHAPPWEAIEEAFVPLLERMGVDVAITLVRHGFYPRGGGAIRSEIRPIDRWRPLSLTTRGEIVHRRGVILTARLPAHVAERENQALRKALGDGARVEEHHVASAGPGNACHVVVVADDGSGQSVTNVFTGIGELGKAAEIVADEAVSQATIWEATGAAVEPQLADQLLLPMALAARSGAGPSTFTTSEPTGHTVTQAELIEELFDVPVRIARDESAAGRYTVRVGR